MTVSVPSSTPTLCINTALAAITHTTTGATGIGAAVGLPAGVTAAWAANTITISGTPTASGTFNYTIPLTGGCGTVSAAGTITVTPDMTVSVPSSTPTLCINTALAAITHTTTGATGIGAAVGLPAGVTAAWAANTITISGTPTASGTFNYTIPLTGGCGTVSAAGTITVTPDMTVSVPSSTPTLCINTALAAITHTTTGATGIGAAVGLPAGVTAAWAANTITISGTPTASGTFNYTIPLTGGCGTVSAAGTITVTPDMTVSVPSSTPTLCINTALAAITHTTTGATGIGAAVGLPAGVTAAWASDVITISGTPTASGTFNYTIPLTGGCGTVSAAGTITVTPDMTVSVPSSTPTLCINTALAAITHTTTGATGIGAAVGLPAGVTAAWAANTITISGTPTASGTFNYTIPLTGGCGTVSAAGTITVTPDMTVSVPSSTPTLCINTALAAITHTTTGATGIGVAVGLPAGVTAAWAANTITISGTPTASGTFNYTIPLTGGCGTVSAAGTITVTPDMTVSVPSSTPTLCINTALAAITHTTTGATGIGAAVGLPAGVTAAWASDVITISGTPTASGTFNYTIPLTGGCGTVSAAGTITVTPDMTVSVPSSTPTLCINTALAAITHTTTGATGIGAAVGLPAGVTAAWAANTITISGTPTASGTFNYTIPLTGGCGTVSAAGTITVTPDMTVSVPSSTPTLCINTALAAITHTTTGATGIGVAVGLPAGVTAAWAANTITISGTPTASGTFNYTIPLTGGCGTVNATGTITVTAVVTVDVSIAADANPVCAGTTVSFTATPTNGGLTPSYQWQVNGLNAGADLPTYSYVPVNDDIVTVILTSSETCQIGGPATSNAVTITVNPVLPVSVTIASDANPVCTGTTVNFTATPTNGGLTPSYQWQVNGSNVGADLPTYSYVPVNGDLVTVILTSSETCQSGGPATSNVVTMNVSSGPSVSSTQVDVLCKDGATGSIDITVTGGIAPYSFAWTGNGVIVNAEDQTGLTAGIYSVIVTDAASCSSSAYSVTLTEPAAALTASITAQTDVLCFGGLTGDATVTAVGGTAPYSYSWNTTPVQTGATATSLAAGTYVVTVTDANSCTTTATVTITEPAALTASITAQTDVLCFGGTTGEAEVTAAGGTAPYSYSWNTTPVQTGATATGLAAGVYIVTVTDNNGCTTTVTATISEPVLLTVTTTQTNVALFGEATGTATAIPAGGTSPYSYSWNTTPVQATETATGLVAGTYTVTVTDANGCTATASVTITEPPAPLTVTITSQTNILCFGDATGSATADASGGAAPYVYSWDTTPVQTGPTATGLVAGTYTVTVTDNIGAVGTGTVTITQPAAALALTSTWTDVLCTGAGNGTATVVATGGTAPYSYSWDSTPVQTTATATGLIPGTYTATVTDANGCVATINVTITEPALSLTVSVTAQTNVLCFGSSTGTATATASGGTAPYTYSWSSTPVQTASTATGLAAGAYTVTVTDANGCTSTDNVTITQPPTGVTIVTTQTNVLCNGGSDGTATATVTGGTAPYSYSWNTTPVQTTASATGLAAGSYIVTVTDADGCTNTQTVVIGEPQTLLLTTDVTDASCPGVTDATINLTITGGTAPFTIIWDDGTTSEDRSSISSGTFSVVVTDANGCSASATVTVGILGLDCLQMPDLFTPNDDGKNDVWRLINIELYPDAELIIFNRWGRRVYQTKNPSANPWDGKFRGRVLPTDSYHYVLDLKDGSLPRSGVVTLIR
jgi:gliding motility-associated-like protein